MGERETFKGRGRKENKRKDQREREKKLKSKHIKRRYRKENPSKIIFISHSAIQLGCE